MQHDRQDDIQLRTPRSTPPLVTKPVPTLPNEFPNQSPVLNGLPSETLAILATDNVSSAHQELSKLKSMTVIAALARTSFLSTMGSGILMSALPRIADDIGLSEGFLLWPASIYSLAAGCLLLVYGAMADIIGAKVVWLTGSCLFMVFTVAVGLSRTGLQMILFRAFLGASISMCLPTTVSLITNTFLRGTWRNVAFATTGAGQPLGYSVGLILGGIFTDTIGWRYSFYIMAIVNAFISLSAIRVLPNV